MQKEQLLRWPSRECSLHCSTLAFRCRNRILLDLSLQRRYRLELTSNVFSVGKVQSHVQSSSLHGSVFLIIGGAALGDQIVLWNLSLCLSPSLYVCHWSLPPTRNTKVWFGTTIKSEKAVKKKQWLCPPWISFWFITRDWSQGKESNWTDRTWEKQKLTSVHQLVTGSFAASQPSFAVFHVSSHTGIARDRSLYIRAIFGASPSRQTEP